MPGFGYTPLLRFGSQWKRKIATKEKPAKDLGNIISKLKAGDTAHIAAGTYTGRGFILDPITKISLERGVFGLPLFVFVLDVVVEVAIHLDRLDVAVMSINLSFFSWFEPNFGVV